MPPRLNIPPFTRILLIALAVESLLSFAIRYRQWSADADIVVPYIALVPQLSLFYPWVLVTTTLLENNVFALGIGAVTILYGGRYLERAWPAKEFVKFLLVAAVIPNVVAVVVLVMLFALTGDMSWTLTTINGTIPLQTAFLVAFSQLIPAHTVTLFRGLISLRVPRFPLLHILAITFLALTPLLTISSFLLSTTAFLSSWTYLRFYKPALPDLDSSQPSSLRGDASESFALAEFFPEVAKPTIAALSTHVYNLLVTLHICTPFSTADLSSARSTSSSIPRGRARAEADRRRALALKALDQRLNAATAARGNNPSTPPPPPPSLVPPVSQPVPATVRVQPQPSQQVELGETTYVPESEEKA